MLLKEEQRAKVLRFRGNLYGLQDAEITRNKLLFDILSEFGLAEMKTAPCVFVGNMEMLFC